MGSSLNGQLYPSDADWRTLRQVYGPEDLQPDSWPRGIESDWRWFHLREVLPVACTPACLLPPRTACCAQPYRLARGENLKVELSAAQAGLGLPVSALNVSTRVLTCGAAGWRARPHGLCSQPQLGSLR
jgi:hypothetical protein